MNVYAARCARIARVMYAMNAPIPLMMAHAIQMRLGRLLFPPLR